MGFFNFNWNNYTDELAAISMPEQWSDYKHQNNNILAEYMFDTVGRLFYEHKVIHNFEQNYAILNTGLYNRHYEQIYAYQHFGQVLFLNDYRLSRKGITERPEKADYFKEPELLVYDWHYPLNISTEQILERETNISRFPEDFINNHNAVSILNNAIETMKKRLAENYRLAIPQYFRGKIQLLLPLCLMSRHTPDAAIVINRNEDGYYGDIILTIDTAYSKARLIAKPDNTWLSLRQRGNYNEQYR
jgi:hypothetical protein